MVSNKLAVNNRPASAGLIEYDSNGEKVKLSPETIRKYLVNGDGTVTDQEIMMFISLCRYQRLNPFLKEAYLIKYGNSTPATIVAGKDVFTKRAQHNPKFAGMQAGVTVLHNGEILEREGALVLPDEELVGGWAKVFIKDYTQPVYAGASFLEYAGKKKDGSLNSQWAVKPATMIRKVALVQALREAFPDNYEGLYSPEEISEANNLMPEIPIGYETPEKGITQQAAPEEITQDPGAALFDE